MLAGGGAHEMILMTYGGTYNAAKTDTMCLGVNRWDSWYFNTASLLILLLLKDTKVVKQETGTGNRGLNGKPAL